MRLHRTKAIGLAAVLALTTLAAWEATSSAAPSNPSAPACPPGTVLKQRRDASGKVIGGTLCVPGRTNQGGDGNTDEGDSGTGGGGDNDGNYLVCEPWGSANPGHTPFKPEGTPDDAEPYQCVQYIDGNPVYGPYIAQWLTPDEVVLPSPEEVAADLLAGVTAELPNPEPVPYPAADVPSVVEVPTFVAVSNWQDAYTTEPGCDPTGQICVVLDLEPELTFDPGDGGAVVACAGGGTTYSLDDGSPRDVAARPGACTHTYTERTGVGDRPDAYQATVTITWAVTFRQTVGGTATGTFDPVPVDGGFTREVSEMQTTEGVPGG